MFYMLRRTWPSMLKTAMICGTICYGLTLGFIYHGDGPQETGRAVPATNVASLSKRVETLEFTVCRLLAGVPAEKIRLDIWDPSESQLIADNATINSR